MEDLIIQTALRVIMKDYNVDSITSLFASKTSVATATRRLIVAWRAVAFVCE